MFLLHYLDMSLCTLLEQSEIVTQRCSIKVILQNLSNFIKQRLWYRFFPVNFAKSLQTTIFHTSVRVCFWRVRCLLKFLSVKFSKFFLWTRQKTVNHYEGTSPYIILKIPDNINGVIFQNFSWAVASENTPVNKICSKPTT